METSRITTTLRIEEPLYQDLHKIALQEMRSLNNLMEYALTRFVQCYRPKDDFQQESHPETIL